MFIEKLATNQGRNDETLNIELADILAEENNTSGIAEIVSGLKMKQVIANDCIKVLYEVGARKPVLISQYASEFLGLLISRNNRLVWGGMTALSCIADISADEIYSQIDKVIYAYENGSVITADNSITVFAKLCRADKRYEDELFPLLIKHLSSCRPKEVAQHAERASICVNNGNKSEFLAVLEKRKPHLTDAQAKRINKLVKSIG